MIQPPQFYTARLEEKVVHNEKYTQLMFELVAPHQLTFQAGQYLSLQVNDQGLRRSYSICSSPNINHGFEFLIDVAPDGVGTRYLLQLQFGQEIKALGPMGVFILAEPTQEDAIILVGTGSGIAPLRAMAFELLQTQQDQRPLTLLWGMRHESQLFWLDEFQELADNFANFRFMPILSRALPEWPLSRGRVTDALQLMELLPRTGFYMCGNDRMILDVIAVLQQRGVEPSFIHHEKFY